jgi:hypothetical protein
VFNVLLLVIDDEELYNQQGLPAGNCTIKQSIVKFYQSNDTLFFGEVQHRDKSKLLLEKQCP